MRTKYFLSVLAATMMSVMVFAQSKNVASARLAYQDATSIMQSAGLEEMGQEDLEKIKNKLMDAVNYIEPATTDAKTSIKEKTWRYRGDIYQLISRMLDKPGFKEIVNDPIGLAGESYMKAMELDKKGSYKNENMQGLTVMENIAVNNGINKYNANEFNGAFKDFELACKLADKMGVVDTTAVFNAGLSADRAENYETAAVYYQKGIDMNFKDTDKLYKFLYDATLKSAGKEKAMEVLNEGIEKYPNNQGLLIDLVNVYLEDGNQEGAKSVLEKSVNNDPNDPVLRYSVGSVYDNLGKKDEARAAYEEAIKLDPNYFEANYNLGASYYNDAAAIIKEVNQLGLNETKKMEEGTAKANALFTQAMPYLEKAYELQPEDPSTVRSLKEVYVRLKMTDKIKNMK